MTQLIALPRDAGARRRRPDGDLAGGGRRHRPAARPRPVPGDLRRGVRPREHRRPAARRILHDAPLLALDLLHQPAARHRWRWSCSRPRCPRGRAPRRAPSTTPAPRCSRSCSSAVTLVVGSRRRRYPWSSPLILGLIATAVARARGSSCSSSGGRRSRCCRRGSSATVVRRHVGRRADRRLRDVRLGHVLPGLPAGGEGREPDRVGDADAADDGRHAGRCRSSPAS